MPAAVHLSFTKIFFFREVNGLSKHNLHPSGRATKVSRSATIFYYFFYIPPSSGSSESRHIPETHVSRFKKEDLIRVEAVTDRNPLELRRPGGTTREK